MRQYNKGKVVRIIAKRTLVNYGTTYADSRAPVLDWYLLMKRCTATNLTELRQTFPTADLVGQDNKQTCFNIKGNHYRLIVQVVYQVQIVYINEFLTHADYTKKYCGGR
jgi:mRNA interferase HigB